MHKGDTSTTLSERFGEPIMSLSKEKREFLKSLKCRRVDYVIVGEQSLAFHPPALHSRRGYSFRPTPGKRAQTLRFLNQFGFSVRLKKTGFLEPKQMIQLGRAPHRIDLSLVLEA